jgi:hypothetical protein
MNTPISVCLITQAAKNEGQARAILQDACKASLSLGAFTLIPCNHTPKCNPSKDEIRDLQRAVPEFHKLGLRAAQGRN